MNMNFSGNNNSQAVAPLNLSKHEILDLTKKAPTLARCIIAAGWDANVSGGQSFDLDISAFILNEHGRVENPETDVVFFNALMQQGISLDGDDLTGSSDGDCERIHVDLQNVSPRARSIVFNVNIFEAQEKRQTFGMVRNSYIRILDEDDNEREIARYELKEEFSNSTAVMFAKLNRRADGGWEFEALGEGVVVKDLNQLLLRFM